MMLKLGFCITGSFCSMDDMLYVLKNLVNNYDVELFMSPHVNTMDTRFYKADELKDKIKEITDKEIHTTIQEAEVYGPFNPLDIVLIYPCDSYTLSKIVYGINDNVITMLVKSSLRNQIPIVLGLYSNDVLLSSGKHMIDLMSRKYFYFVPMFQDNYKTKPFSMLACKNQVNETLKEALLFKQKQPFMLGYRDVKE